MKKLLVLGVIAALIGCESKEEKLQRLNEIGYSYAQEVVKNELIDPASAQFKNQKGFCGEVNSKNKMGGYVGFSRFIVLSPKSVIFENERNFSTKQFPKAWDSICNQPFDFKDNKVIPPKFELPEPSYDQPKYHFKNDGATATPSKLVMKDGIYIYPVLQVHCKQGETSFALYSMHRVSYEMNGMIGLDVDDGEMNLIPFDGREEYQEFGANKQLTKAIKTANKVSFAFKTIDGGFTAQEFSVKDLRHGMREQVNSCNWADL
ncbi:MULTISPECIES: hypothetical protein [unclassified Acinetobacter]|uniref:hypothetical protein n=1 Tax=unclassified Acinetobacter TaxID=196816 RepID=UPI0015D1AFD6|nr:MULTISPECIES: hypothetical protein [unclassified Acinetobacter]